MSACDCCNEPPDMPIVLEWDSLSVSFAKIGHGVFNGGGYSATPEELNKRYLTRTRTNAYSGSRSVEGISGGSNPFIGGACCFSIYRVTTEIAGTIANGSNYILTSPPNGYTLTGSSSGSATLNVTSEFVEMYNRCDEDDPSDCEGMEGTPDPPYEENLTGNSPSDSVVPIVSATRREGSFTNQGIADGLSVVIELTDEYTTEMLESLAEDQLSGEMPGTWSGSAGSYRNLASNEITIAARRAAWRLKHYPTGYCYLKIWLRLKTQPLPSGTPEYEDIAPYEWIGTGNACFPDPTKPFFADENIIYSEPIEIPLPTTNATVTVEIVKYSYLPDYEPGEGESNGYPTPA